MKLDTSPKAIMAIALIVMLGLLFGAVGWLMNRPDVRHYVKPKNDFCQSVKLEACYGKRVKVIGTFESLKGYTTGVIVNPEKAESIFLEGFPQDYKTVNYYDGKKVEVIGIIEKHSCPPATQCWGGTVIKHIDSIKILETSETAYREGLNKEISNKIEKLDKSCQFNEDCKTVELLSLIQANGTHPICVNKGEDIKEIRSLQDLYYKKYKSFLPNILIAPTRFYGCECKQNVCTEITKKPQEVTITTDKTEYEQGETVKITIKNNLDKKMYIGSPPYSIEKFDNGVWIEIKTVFCPCEALCKLGASIVQPNGITEYQWNQKESWCSDPKRISTTISNQVDPGIYRIKTQISNEDDSNKKTIYSNEFTIKEKSATDPRCSKKVEFDRLCAPGSLFRGYEFDSGEGKCVEKQEIACPPTSKTPFNSLEECQKVCEKRSNEKKLEFETIEKESYGYHKKAENLVIKNIKDWTDLWNSSGHSALPPAIDFDEEMILAVLQGEKSTGGYSIEINWITEKENEIEVSVLETSPGRRCIVTQALTSPFHIVKLAKQAKEIKFNATEMTNNCEAYGL